MSDGIDQERRHSQALALWASLQAALADAQALQADVIEEQIVGLQQETWEIMEETEPIPN